MEIAHAWVLLIVVPIFKFLHIPLTCEVEAPRCVPIRLYCFKASHRNLVRLRAHHAKPVDSFRRPPAFANECPLV